MHLLVREIRSLDEQSPAEDLQHEPADIIFLSFSDNDLNIMQTCLDHLPPDFPSVRLAPLKRLRHPMSVDLYLEDTLSKAKVVILRLIGSVEYWRYGTEEISTLCRANNIPLLVMSGEGYEDQKLDELCTISPALLERFKRFFNAGGAQNFIHALHLAATLINQHPPHQAEPETLPMVGEYPLPLSFNSAQPTAFIIFYRAHLLADNIEPIQALANTLNQRGLNIKAVYVNSLKDPMVMKWIEQFLQIEQPKVILNATYFSIQQDQKETLFHHSNAPILQVLHPSNSKALWESSFRGLSQTDLAIQVVLPELDGKLLTTAIAFKKEVNGQLRYAPYAEGIDLVAERALGWVTLATKQNQDKKIAIFLSNYPGVGGQEGHAVGLDSFASLHHILRWLQKENYQIDPIPSLKELTHQLCQEITQPTLSLHDYQTLFSELPSQFQKAVLSCWPILEKDDTYQEGYFTLRYQMLGNIILAIQPERATQKTHKTLYHDPETPPSHGYIATYLWLRKTLKIDAMIHLGTHGTLEWLPSKTTALSDHCSPIVLLRGLPVIYPFIVNNPGEAACAKRRLGAVTIGHLTPPINKAILSGTAAQLERLIDDYAEADGLDQRRSKILLQAILDKADACGLLAETGINRKESGDEVALNHLDAYLCDVKDLQIREGLHIFGTPPAQYKQLLNIIQTHAPQQSKELEKKLQLCADNEKKALLKALNGQFIQAGPAGAPTRGRLDVLPTGRNLYTVDPRSIPTQTAYILAQKAAEQLLLRYMQENGDHLHRIVIDLWGSTNLRTGGEDLALAYILMGAAPIWDQSSGRVTAIEILPIARMDRPRVDVTLRISGLFRDAFEDQINLFDQTIQAIAQRNESEEWNSLASLYQKTPASERHTILTRIYGTAKGTYGTGIETPLSTGTWEEQKELGQLWLKNSAYTYGGDKTGAYDELGLSERLKTTQAFLHSQDHAEIDLLDSPDYATHEGGFAAAAQLFDNYPTLYHVDTSNAEAPKIRLLIEEVNRITRGRAANPAWVKSMMAHSYRGAAEIARSIDALFGFAATLSHRFDQQFDLVFAATLGNDEVRAFLQDSNHAAKISIQNRFQEARNRGLWHPKSNSVTMILEQSDE